jgi:predicted nucleotidyltransferase
MFMAMRGFFEQQAVQLEDVYIGHAVQMHGRKVKSIQLDQPILLHAAALPGLHRVLE